MMSTSEGEERAYRRGYVQGAAATFRAMAEHLPEPDRSALLRWIDRDLMRWRAAASSPVRRRRKSRL